MQIIKPPSHWQYEGKFMGFAEVFEHKLMNCRVIRSIATVKDGSEWIHVSVSRKGGVPSWEILSKCKNEFIGEDKEAYQVLAAKKDHVNIADCLHLWAPLDGVRRVANLHDLIDERVP